MLYCNKKNGAVVDFCSEIKGGLWELVEVPRPAKASGSKPVAKAPKKTTPKK